MKTQRWFPWLALFALAICNQPAWADAWGWGHSGGWEYAANGRLVDVQVQVEGRTMPLYQANGRPDRHYFQAFRGKNYAIVLDNNSGERVGVLLAVDGLNVVNGEISSLGRREPMYVLDPHERAVIRGWRNSLQSVRRFVFVDEERSYAERTGQANSDMGWVRVLAFREKRLAWRNVLPYRQAPEREDGSGRDELDRGSREEAPAPLTKGQEAPAPMAGDQAPQDSRGAKRMEGELRDFSQNEAPSNPGTGWGEQRYDPVRRVWFEPERQATDHLVLRYEYASGLRALGIFPRGNQRLWERDGDLGFAQPPRW